jgi:hypothetical protein
VVPALERVWAGDLIMVAQMQGAVIVSTMVPRRGRLSAG